MSSALAMVLMAGMVVPGNGPKKVSGELTPYPFAGTWQGIMQFEGFADKEIGMTDGKLTVCPNLGDQPIAFSGPAIYQGRGQLRIHMIHVLGNGDCLGIHRQDGDRLIICLREPGKERPTSFNTDNHQALIILHRVKPSK